MLVEENNVPITVEFLESKGFEISKANPHIYEVDAVGRFFSVVKHINNGEGIVEEFRHLNYKDFVVEFHTYYQDVNFYGFKYEHQILNLYYCLTGENL
jgi:hypothetical protein